MARTTETYDPPLTQTIYSYYTEPTPTCTVAATADKSGLETYVPCTTGYPGYCFIYGTGGVKLYYWPVTTTCGDFCSQNGSTVFAQPTSPPNPDIVVIDDHTFTRPTHYLSVPHAYAQLHGDRHYRTACGTRSYQNIVVPITPSGFSSFGGGATKVVNFEDFNTVPYASFKGQRRCRNKICATVEGAYTPNIPLPTELRNVDAEWAAAGCRQLSDGIFLTPVPIGIPTPTPSADKRLL